ncbi:MAG: hypothetical protein KDK70_40560 [Myxococcales bacterium]|nr:hypothetical protein [Myxococcales bacterium]
MNVWIFALSAVFTPVIEPLGLSSTVVDELSPVVVVDPSPMISPMMSPMIMVEPIDDAQSPTVLDDMRYPGLERMLAKLDAGQ